MVKLMLRGCSFVYLILAIHIVLFAVSNSDGSHVDPKVFLTPVDMATAEIPKDQTARLDKIKKLPSTVDFCVVQLHAEVLDGKPVSVTLPGNKQLLLSEYKITTDGEVTRIVWRGGNEAEQAVITIRGNSVTGIIYTDKKVYNIEPLGKGLQVVTQTNQVVFKEKN